MRVYLAGAMHGVPDLNFPAFKRARESLRSAGHVVFCPAEHALNSGERISPELNADQAFRRRMLGADLAWICAEAEAVVLLPGWQASSGAKAERAVAEALGLKIVEL